MVWTCLLRVSASSWAWFFAETANAFCLGVVSGRVEFAPVLSARLKDPWKLWGWSSSMGYYLADFGGGYLEPGKGLSS